MIKIDRYIRNNVLFAMLLVLLVLGGLDLIFTLVDEIGETDDMYGAGDAISYVMLTFPRHVYELLPMTALIGSLIGLGILASSNELVVLQASGVRIYRIVWAVMKPAILVMVAGLILGQYIAPRLELRGELDRALARGEQVALSRYGHWQRDGNEFMHFNAIDPDGVLHGISIYTFDEARHLSSLVTAETASYTDDNDAGHWLLQKGNEEIFNQDPEQPRSTNRQFDSMNWQADLSPDLLKVLIIDPDQMAISDLYRYANRFEEQGQDGRPYFLSFWKKILQPLTTGALVIVAIAFIFGPLREATMGSRVFTAISFGILFYLLQSLLSTVSLVYQLNPLLTVLVPILICIVIGGILLKRTM